MKNFYVGPIKKMNALNIRYDENNKVVYDENINIEEENVFFYKNFRDNLVRYDDNSSPILEDEVYDLICMYYSHNMKDTCSFEFVDLKDLKKIDKKETPKTYKKILSK